MKAPTGIAIGSKDLNRRQNPALETHQTTGIGLSGVPTHHEVGTLPAIWSLRTRQMGGRCAVIHGGLD